MVRNDTKLVSDAPGLEREGVKQRIEDENALTMLERWRDGIIKSYGMTQLLIEEQIEEGVENLQLTW